MGRGAIAAVIVAVAAGEAGAEEAAAAPASATATGAATASATATGAATASATATATEAATASASATEAAPAAGETAPAAPTGAASGVAPAKLSGGPSLELDGLDEPPAPAEKGKSLSARAEAILDRTTLGGYGEYDFVMPREGASTFRQHRYVLFVQSQLAERISTATEIEWEWAGTPLKKDGTLDVGEVLLEYSVVDVKIAEWLVLRAGVLLMPTSTLNLHHDAPAQELPDRPIAYTTVNPSTWFESGAGALGKVDLGGAGRLSYEAYVVNGLDAKIEDGLGLRGARGSHLQDNNDDKALTARLAWSPLLGLEVAGAGYTGAYDLEGRRVLLLNGGLSWRLGALDLHGEYVRVAIDPGYVQGFSAGSTANTRAAVPEAMDGFYAQADWRLQISALQEALPDEFRDGHLGLSLRYEESDTDDAVTSEGDVAQLTFGLNVRPIPAFVWKNGFAVGKGGVAFGGSPHAWDGRFWDEPDWRWVSSAAFLF